MTLDDLTLRVEALELGVEALVRELWNDAYPPGHAEREQNKPEYLKRIEERRLRCSVTSAISAEGGTSGLIDGPL